MSSLFSHANRRRAARCSQFASRKGEWRARGRGRLGVYGTPRAGPQAAGAALHARAPGGSAGAITSMRQLHMRLDGKISQNRCRREGLEGVTGLHRRRPDARAVAGRSQVAADAIVITAVLYPGIGERAQALDIVGIGRGIGASGQTPFQRRAHAWTAGRPGATSTPSLCGRRHKPSRRRIRPLAAQRRAQQVAADLNQRAVRVDVHRPSCACRHRGGQARVQPAARGVVVGDASARPSSQAVREQAHRGELVADIGATLRRDILEKTCRRRA